MTNWAVRLEELKLKEEMFLDGMSLERNLWSQSFFSRDLALPAEVFTPDISVSGL
jgi:hypothetical protein